MSQAVKPKQADSSAMVMVRLTGVLCAICAVCALLLGLTDMATRDRIAQVAREKKEAAMAAVLPADSYEQVAYTGTDATILEAYKAGDKGWVLQVVNSDLTVSGVEIVESAETSGLGANAKKPVFRDQFTGKSGEVKVTKDGGEIDALTGATITSRAVSAGVTSALAAAATLG